MNQFISHQFSCHGVFPVIIIVVCLLQFLSCSLQFVEKAPGDVVHGVQEKAAEAEEKIILTKNRLALLKSSVLVTE